MKINNTLKSFIGVVFSNISTILSGVFIGVIMPKLLSVEGFGFYKTFTLYVTYIGVFSLGIIDGIVLKYGGQNFEDIDQKRFRSFFKWYLFVNLVASIFVFLISLVFISDFENKFIFVAFSINIVFVNISGYFQQISQITQRFKEYSLRRIIQSILYIILVSIFVIVFHIQHEVDYRNFIISIILINIILSIWYIHTYKLIIFGEAFSLSETKSEIKELIIIGLPLLISNICSVLIITLDSQIVNILFSTRDYAFYAFAYNILSLVNIATAAISTVLYPILKRNPLDRIMDVYPKIMSVLQIFLVGALTLYFPLSLFIEWFLPKYIDALPIFRVIFPSICFSTPIVVIMHNYYKTLNKSAVYFKKSIVVIFVSLLNISIAYLLYKSIISISIASIITLIFWYLYAEHELVKLFSINRRRNILYILFSLISFYTIT
ncbi:oligosaccharide flippase family protein, partial [Streptococcus uberis]|uniref:lipopolysaccharide biosynthesis protein n=1 Tax=Streptococcus uberis TaxID=1349 RepID=UPI002EB4F0FD|nr:oligosaccharide flippase family protein [Streptococcus uberis]